MTRAYAPTPRAHLYAIARRCIAAGTRGPHLDTAAIADAIVAALEEREPATAWLDGEHAPRASAPPLRPSVGDRCEIHNVAACGACSRTGGPS